MTSTIADTLPVRRGVTITFREILLTGFLVASPFYMFSVVAGRDWPALWVLLGIAVFVAGEVITRGGWFWLDRSFFPLWLFVGVYAVAMLIVYFDDSPVVLLGRTPGDRAIAITSRIVYVAAAYSLFVHVLAGLSSDGLRRMFVTEMTVGVLIAAFGILQYVSYMVFGSRALIELEPTSETYKLYSSFIGHGSDRTFRSAAVFNEPSVFGFFLAPLLVKAVVARTRGVLIGTGLTHNVFIGILIAAVLMNLSMTSTLAVAVMMTLFLAGTLRRRGQFLPFVAGLAGALLLVAVTPLGALIFERVVRIFDLRDLSTLDRLFRASSGLDVFWENFWFGVGPGGFAFHHPRYGQLLFGGLASPLNTWLFWLTDVGVLGCLPIAAFLIHVVRRGRRVSSEDPLAGVYLWGLGTYAVLLSTIDSWYLEGIWFQLAMVIAIANVWDRRRCGWTS